MVDPHHFSDMDTYWMQQALRAAQTAASAGEVPVGAILVDAQQRIATGANQPISAHDPTAHAEIIALRAAGQQLQNYRLPGMTLYVTLEPCAMCAGAIIQARLARVVFAADDPRAGALRSVFQLFAEPRLNHQPQWQGGLCADEAAQLLKDFFKARR